MSDPDLLYGYDDVVANETNAPSDTLVSIANEHYARITSSVWLTLQTCRLHMRVPLPMFPSLDEDMEAIDARLVEVVKYGNRFVQDWPDGLLGYRQTSVAGVVGVVLPHVTATYDIVLPMHEYRAAVEEGRL